MMKWSAASGTSSASADSGTPGVSVESRIDTASEQSESGTEQSLLQRLANLNFTFFNLQFGSELF